MTEEKEKWVDSIEKYWQHERKKYWEEKDKQKNRLEKLSKEIDEIIDKDIDQVPEDKVIVENPPLPELDVIKFAMEKGNDEIAMWLREGRESGFLDETMIGIALMKYECPMIFEPEYSCLVKKETWKELFHHFKDMHYNKEAELRHAKHLFYEYWMSTFTNDKTTPQERARVKREAENPEPHQLERHLEHVKNRLTWRDTAYAMLQECFVFEANSNYTGNSGPNSAKTKKRAVVLYKFQKIYGLTTKQIAKIFDYTIENTRKNIYSGMMHEHGNNDKNLPQWMQNVLKSKKDS